MSPAAFLCLETLFHVFAENLPISLIFYFHVRHFVRKAPVVEEEDSDLSDSRGSVRRSSSLDQGQVKDPLNSPSSGRESPNECSVESSSYLEREGFRRSGYGGTVIQGNDSLFDSFMPYQELKEDYKHRKPSPSGYQTRNYRGFNKSSSKKIKMSEIDADMRESESGLQSSYNPLQQSKRSANFGDKPNDFPIALRGPHYDQELSSSNEKSVNKSSPSLESSSDSSDSYAMLTPEQ